MDRDCVQGRDQHPEAVTNYLLVIDRDGLVWSWATGAATDAFTLMAEALLQGTILGLISGILVIGIREIYLMIQSCRVPQ
jgi:hypothetical protein